MIKKCTGIGILVTLIAVLVLFPAVTAAQDPLPPADPDQSWTPPEGDNNSYLAPGAKSRYESAPTTSSSTSAPSSSSYCPPPPGMHPSIMSTSFLDESGRVRSRIGNEPFYLRVQVNTPGYFYLAEYFPQGSGMSPQWLMYRYELDRAGSWVFGPFYPDVYEPAGQHVWRMWLLSSGMWAQKAASFDFKPSVMPNPQASIQAAEFGIVGMVPMIIIMVLIGALGVTIGMLVSSRHRYSN